MNHINDFLAAAQEAQSNGLSIDDLVENISSLAASGKTALGLNRWVDTDKPKMEDFNRDNEILDREIGALKTNKANLDGANFSGTVRVNRDNFILNKYEIDDNTTGNVLFEKSANSTLVDGANIDFYNEILRIYERGGNVRGVNLDLKNTLPGVVSSLWHSSNLVVNYGDWTPVIRGSHVAGTAVQSYTNGKFFRIGNICYLTMMVNLDSLAGASGAFIVDGLPFVGVIDSYGAALPLNLTVPYKVNLTSWYQAWTNYLAISCSNTSSGYYPDLVLTTDVTNTMQYVRMTHTIYL